MFVATRLTGRRAHEANAARFALIGVIAPITGDPAARIAVASRSLAEFKKTLQMGTSLRDDVLAVTFCLWAPSKDDADRVKAKAEDTLAARRGSHSWFKVPPDAAQEAVMAAAAELKVDLFGEAERLRRIDDKVAASARRMTGGR